MGVFLWILQILLALIFSITGVLKLTQKKEDVVDRMGYVEDFTQKQLYGIGVLEILGALGLVLPPLTGIYPVLTIFAALGLAIIMVGAFFTHLRREEIIPMGVMNVMLFTMALFVAYGRWALVPG
jgi:uncharacterized membrane protein YphA (DoxX/SURF4 family)